MKTNTMFYSYVNPKICIVKRKSHKAEWSINFKDFFSKNQGISETLMSACLKQILLLNINMKYFTTYEN
jgi:hypothetical protein